jgi:hypothetical protein
MITVKDYFMGRDVEYAGDFTPTIAANGASITDKINELLARYVQDTKDTGRTIASGWRPPAVNDATSNAACHSHHLDATAGDVRDTEERDLARWVAGNQAVLVSIGLWCERFEWTPDWVHFQDAPPKSGNRFFIPSTAPAKCGRLPEQDMFHC